LATMASKTFATPHMFSGNALLLELTGFGPQFSKVHHGWKKEQNWLKGGTSNCPKLEVKKFFGAQRQTFGSSAFGTCGAVFTNCFGCCKTCSTMWTSVLGVPEIMLTNPNSSQPFSVRHLSASQGM